MIFSAAELCQITENKFNIEVKTFLHYGKGEGIDGTPFLQNEIQIWTGEVTMDSLYNGKIIWEQRNPPNGNTGYKQLLINKAFDGCTIVGEPGYGFFLEQFTEKIDIDCSKKH